MYGYTFDFLSIIFCILLFIVLIGLPIAVFVFVIRFLYKYFKMKSDYYQTKSQYYWTMTQYYNLHMHDRQD